MRVLIADDDRGYRRYLRRMLENEKSILVVGEALDGAEALELGRKLRPDVVLMDLDMPVQDGLEATRRLKIAMPWVKVVILSSAEGEVYRKAAAKHKADGFVYKGAALKDVLGTIHSLSPPPREV